MRPKQKLRVLNPSAYGAMLINTIVSGGAGPTGKTSGIVQAPAGGHPPILKVALSRPTTLFEYNFCPYSERVHISCAHSWQSIHNFGGFFSGPRVVALLIQLDIYGHGQPL